jgi:hypothetical protein
VAALLVVLHSTWTNIGGHKNPLYMASMKLPLLPLSSMPDRCEFPLLIQDEYETMEEILNRGQKGREGSVFLTGQSGIGMKLGLSCKWS